MNASVRSFLSILNAKTPDSQAAQSVDPRSFSGGATTLPSRTAMCGISVRTVGGGVGRALLFSSVLLLVSGPSRAPIDLLKVTPSFGVAGQDAIVEIWAEEGELVVIEWEGPLSGSSRVDRTAEPGRKYWRLDKLLRSLPSGHYDIGAALVQDSKVIKRRTAILTISGI